MDTFTEFQTGVSGEANDRWKVAKKNNLMRRKNIGIFEGNFQELNSIFSILFKYNRFPLLCF